MVTAWQGPYFKAHPDRPAKVICRTCASGLFKVASTLHQYFVSDTHSETIIMSFGFAIVDFFAIADITQRLYRGFYKDVETPNSVVVSAGEERVIMMNVIVTRIRETLEELEKLASRPLSPVEHK
ncbi:hypothetical protein MKZ38_010685 [Zalerion maritima]|uniref:Uncharacterized protein n=1 Tax=Zalerion maritima TaxID=339359 RepID=A0AAD5WTZ9_9PEZI|nr:hypothetical protein MKZ38_010685 [Zalerion maritima]